MGIFLKHEYAKEFSFRNLKKLDNELTIFLTSLICFCQDALEIDPLISVYTSVFRLKMKSLPYDLIFEHFHRGLILLKWTFMNVCHLLYCRLLSQFHNVYLYIVCRESTSTVMCPTNQWNHLFTYDVKHE